MTAPAPLGYGSFADRLIAGGILVDPWFEGQPRFAMTPLALRPSQWAALRKAAEGVAAVYNEVCLLCARSPELLDDFFALTPFQKIMWASSAPQWHGIARADLFETDQGLLACELNCDTPTGEPEAVLLNRAVAPDHPDAVDPNARLEAAFCAMVEAIARSTFGEPFDRSAGLVYPTELTEDLPLVRLYQQWLEARGWKVVLGSPFNLTLDPSGVPALFGAPCPVILRHYKTDWWGERVAAWQDDEPFADAQPLGAQLGVLLEGLVEGKCVVVNPFGSVVPQNKKAMAFMWERIQLFSEPAQEIIRRHVPYTVRLEALHREQLSAQRQEWVLKSDYGCEGDEIVIGQLLAQEEWDRALELAVPKRWIAQRHFQVVEAPGAESVNYGVYLVGGEAAGIYCRTQKGPTNNSARSVPCFVTSEEP